MKRKRVSKAIVHQPAAQFYDRFVESIKKRIRTAQIKAALAANAQLVLHYWEIGCDILASQKREGWGAKVIDRLANDLQREFPKLSGYSARNLKYMRAFAEVCPDREIVDQLGAQSRGDRTAYARNYFKAGEADPFGERLSPHR